MATISELLRLTLQATNDNPDTWGTVLNNSTIELLEDAFGYAQADVTSADVTLNTDDGTDNAPHYRRMIIDIIGSPGVARNVNAPAQISSFNIAKVYLVINNTSGGQTITFKTTAGAGVVIPAGDAYWCYGDGTDILAAKVESAGTATTATTATNATQLGGVAAASYAQLGTAQTFTKGQAVSRVTLTDVSNVVTPDLSVSNNFYCLWGGNWTLAAPLNPVDGGSFSLWIEQDTGGPHTITFASNTYVHEGGSVFTLSTGTGDIDWLAFEYIVDHPAGARWGVAGLKDMA